MRRRTEEEEEGKCCPAKSVHCKYASIVACRFRQTVGRTDDETGDDPSCSFARINTKIHSRRVFVHDDDDDDKTIKQSHSISVQLSIYLDEYCADENRFRNEIAKD